ncbi:MAG TPA: hypothetical protein VL625_06840 [Patescibacteria group bacterium]|nr:hypothetical protein [Patescibacteria group bacterium]
MPSAAVAAQHNGPAVYHEEHRMKGPFTASLIFHAIVISFCIFGIPYIHKDVPIPPEPLSVELARPDELTKAVKPPAHVMPHPPPQQLEKPPPVPQMPQVTTPTPPKAVEPEKPPEPEVKPTPMKEADEIAPPVKKPVKPHKPPEKKPVKEKAEEQKQAFQSLLRNMMPNKPAPAANDTPDKSEKSSPDAPTAQSLTADEFESLRRQLSECWSVMGGARDAADISVDVKLVMNPDRTVQSRQVVDQFRYASDPVFRAAADSTIRAIDDPHCNPLNLPADKYSLWKVMTVQFDPKEMLQ